MGLEFFSPIDIIKLTLFECEYNAKKQVLTVSYEGKTETYKCRLNNDGYAYFTPDQIKSDLIKRALTYYGAISPCYCNVARCVYVLYYKENISTKDGADDGWEIHHNNENRTDNNPLNLIKLTKKEHRELHRDRAVIKELELITQPDTPKKRKSRLTAYARKKVYNLHTQGLTAYQISKKLKHDIRTIRNILQGFRPRKPSVTKVTGMSKPVLTTTVKRQKLEKTRFNNNLHFRKWLKSQTADVYNGIQYGINIHNTIWYNPKRKISNKLLYPP